MTISYDRLFIGGEWVRPSSAAVIEVTAASTGEPISRVAEARGRDGDPGGPDGEPGRGDGAPGQLPEWHADLDRDYNPTIRDIYLDNVNATPTVSTTRPAFVISNADSRSPFQNVVYENSTFYTPAAFASAFAGQDAFFENLVISNVRFINPQTGAVTTYGTTRLGLLNQTTANANGTAVPLTAVSVRRRNVVTALPSDSFTISGKVNLAAYPGFLTGGSVAVYVDRDTTPVPATVKPDGSFTSGPITLNNDDYWYAGRHYVAVSLPTGSTSTRWCTRSAFRDHGGRDWAPSGTTLLLRGVRPAGRAGVAVHRRASRITPAVRIRSELSSGR